MPECQPVAMRAVSFGVADAPDRTDDPATGRSAARRPVSGRGALVAGADGDDERTADEGDADE